MSGLPLDVVRVRQQTDFAASTNMLKQALSMVRLEGPATLLRGATYPLATITVQVRDATLRLFLSVFWAASRQYPLTPRSDWPDILMCRWHVLQKTT